MAAASNDSGLSNYLGQELVYLKVLPPFLILIIIATATTFLTEVSSNTAVANIILPVLAHMVSLSTDLVYVKLDIFKRSFPHCVPHKFISFNLIVCIFYVTFYIQNYVILCDSYGNLFLDYVQFMSISIVQNHAVSNK